MSPKASHKRDPNAPPSELHGRVVSPSGPPDAPVLIIGERPGYVEATQGRPFVGPTGRLQSDYLRKGGVHVSRCRLANVVWGYDDNNSDPTDQSLARWRGQVLAETQRAGLKVVIAVGRFAMRWFLGEDAELDTSRGLPHYAGAFDPTRTTRTRKGVVVVPVTHPAASLHNVDIRAQVMDDYARACDVVKRVLAGEKVKPRVDEFAGQERYEDVTGFQLSALIDKAMDDGEGMSELALDTEGSANNPWSIQCSWEVGTGYTLRASRPDFRVGVAAIQRCVDQGVTIIVHQAHSPDGCCHDFRVCRAMGLELRRAHIFDTMFAAGLLRLEPRGLKALAYRYCGMAMVPYEKVIGDVARSRQHDYLVDVISRVDEWPKPEERIEWSNDGTARPYKPKALAKIAEGIVVDMADTSNPKKGAAVNPWKRWTDSDEVQRLAIEKVLGPMPRWGSLDDVPLADAVYYGCKDADGTLRVAHALRAELARLNLTNTMRQSMEALPVFEEMEDTGMPVSPPKLQTLHDELSRDIDKLCSVISAKFYGGRPFNPKSTKNVTSMMLRRSLEGAERTKGGRISTGKKSIEHLRHTDEAMSKIVEWREKQHIRDMYCVPTLARLSDSGGGSGDDIRIHTKLNPFGTTTRRLASNDPNLLAFPKHEKPGGFDYGQRIRDCFVAPDGWVFLECDLSQIEARLLAHESADPLLCELFNSGRDVHTETASRVFGVAPDAVTKIQRFLAKRVTFGIAYGVSGTGLASQIRLMPDADLDYWTAEKCDEVIQGWLRLYVGCDEYFKRIRRETKATGMVRDHWGMIRYLPSVWSDKEGEVQAAYREAINHRIQGAAQGCLQEAVGWLRPRIWELQDGGIGVQWLLTVHDSLLLLVEEWAVGPVKDLVIEGMIAHNGLVDECRVPILADAKWGTSWGKL